MNFGTIYGDRLIAEVMSWKGTPFFHNTRKKGIGADCLGLILGTWENVNNVIYNHSLAYASPPNFLPYQLSHINNFDDIVKNIPISEKVNGDVMCIQLSKYQLHLAFYVQKDDLEFLVHSRVKLGVTEEYYSQFWKSKTIKMFRLMEI